MRERKREIERGRERVDRKFKTKEHQLTELLPLPPHEFHCVHVLVILEQALELDTESAAPYS